MGPDIHRDEHVHIHLQTISSEESPSPAGSITTWVCQVEKAKQSEGWKEVKDPRGKVCCVP